MSSGQSSISTAPSPRDGQLEKFETPEITSLASLTDGRGIGDYRTAYPFSAWAQIIAELLYLLVVLAVAFGILIRRVDL
jgi:hypothetical protein